MRWTASCCSIPDGTLAYRDMISLIEHDSPPAGLRRPARQAGGRAPVAPGASLPHHARSADPPDGEAGQCLLSIVAADRPGLLFTVASTLDEHNINVHTAKIATLGERVEDTFLVSGAELAKTATLVKLEQDLLAVLQV
jgi:[protein-PII] uridylyltransferase